MGDSCAVLDASTTQSVGLIISWNDDRHNYGSRLLYVFIVAREGTRSTQRGKR